MNLAEIRRAPEGLGEPRVCVRHASFATGGVLVGWYVGHCFDVLGRSLYEGSRRRSLVILSHENKRVLTAFEQLKMLRKSEHFDE